MDPKLRAILTLINVFSLVAAIYYFWPGFEHLGTSGTGSQPTAGAAYVIVFLFAFLTALQLTPKKQ